MSAAWRRRALLLATWAVAWALAFAALHTLLGDGGDDRPAGPPRAAVPGGPAPAGTTPGGADAVELTAALEGTRYSDELTFEVTERQARTAPPPQVRDCRQFASWARRNEAVPVGGEPVHVLTVRAGRSVDVAVHSVVAVPVAEVPQDRERGPRVELTCREAGPTPTVTPDVRKDRGPHVLVPGQAIRLLVDLDAPEPAGLPFPSRTRDYYLRVDLEVDGVTQVRELRDEAGGYFRCCGRITYMGYLAARYEWTLSPTPTLRYCPELRWVDEPPPRVCQARRPG
ncbi:hypothetical protein ACFY2R_23475 [Micromonospora olivasterospora]|uniref:Lipoprotein n=1 Tax=Micromonospora olivasterospora TaxID=1880 RepID=A0A562IIN9_MICOL|nr:hypothetical protein [Micromonospora olivasterospora]TWH70585.1 hypothetical protein JD77_05610 [Micromonospora olivasterospora]